MHEFTTECAEVFHARVEYFKIVFCRFPSLDEAEEMFRVSWWDVCGRE